jgi:chromatin structure-remodeling complex subunit RSC1/2
VRDVTLICHNAQVYNRPSAQFFRDAAMLLDVFKEKLNELVNQGDVTPEEAAIPDLGPLPEFEESPPPEEGEDEEEDEEEEEDEDDEDDDSDDEGGKRRNRRRARPSSGRRETGGDDDDPHKKRGRPPKVFTPLEARIQALLKGVRKFKGADGHVRIVHFEKLPDKSEAPDYHTSIKELMSLELIKKKHKRKKYPSVDSCLADFELMFENAKRYNEEGSEIHQDAAELQKQVRLLAEQEKAKPDSDFRDGNVPLTEVEHRGEIWRVGKWK